MAHEKSADTKLLETIEATAERLSVSRSKVYELLNRKELDGVKIDRSHRVVVDSSRRYVKRLVERLEGERTHKTEIENVA